MAVPYLPPGYMVPKVTTWDTPWWLRGNLSTIPPPLGVQPNFVNPESKHIYNLVVQGICLPLATIVVALRVYTKTCLLRHPGWEDWTSVVGWVGLVLYSSIMFLQDRHGAGVHMWNVKGDDYTELLKLLYITEIVYGPIVFVIKLAILLLYMRLFKPIKRTFIALQLTVWLNLLAYTIGLFIEVFQCKPFTKIWWPLMPGRCLDQKAVQLASSSFNIISDFVILILPMISVWSLKMSRRKQLGLCFVFAIGLS